MRIGTWNVRGITDKTAEIIQEAKKYNIDILALSETKKKGCGNEEIDGYVHLWSGVGKDQRASSGVSLLIKNNLKKYIKDYEYTSDRIITTTIKLYGHKTKVISIYAPIETSPNHIKDQFNEGLANVINKTRKHEDIIVAGDLNARVKSMSDDDVVGRFAEEIENTNGERLIELCNQYQLQLTNTRFAHKNIHSDCAQWAKWTVFLYLNYVSQLGANSKKRNVQKWVHLPTAGAERQQTNLIAGGIAGCGGRCSHFETFF